MNVGKFVRLQKGEDKVFLFCYGARGGRGRKVTVQTRKTRQVDYRIVSKWHRRGLQRFVFASRRRLNTGLDWACNVGLGLLTVPRWNIFFLFLSCSVHPVLITRPTRGFLYFSFFFFFDDGSFFSFLSFLCVRSDGRRKLSRHS